MNIPNQAISKEDAEKFRPIIEAAWIFFASVLRPDSLKTTESVRCLQIDARYGTNQVIQALRGEGSK